MKSTIQLVGLFCGRGVGFYGRPIRILDKVLCICCYKTHCVASRVTHA